MSGLGRAVVVVAALALVLCDLSSRPGLTPAQAGFFSKAKDGTKDKDKEKDKDAEKGSSSSTSSKDSKKGSSGGFFSGSKGKSGSSGGSSSSGSSKKSDDDTKKKSGGGFFGGSKGKPTSSSGSKSTWSSGKSVGTKTSSGGMFGGAKSTPGTSSSSRSGGGAATPRVGRSGGGYFEKAARPRSGPVWEPRRSPSGGFFGTARRTTGQTRNAQGYFSHVNRLKSSSRVRYGQRYPRAVDWWYWWYPYDMRYYHWHFGYYDPFAPDYAFLFVYVGGHHPTRYYPYYIYHPVPRPSVIVITRWSDREEASYYDRSRVEGALGEAVRDIEYGWRYENLGRIMRHVDAQGEIRVYYGDTYSHNMTASEFEELTDEAFETTRTGSMRLDRVIRLSDGWVKAKGRHVFYDPNGDRREVYVYYLLEEVRDGWHREWVIREIGQGPEPY